jgi:predicted unusual protein kinase regulating ubiquinone biosynthesis (AarF/ABC1/UbiB family)
MAEAPLSAPDAGEDAWEASRPNMRSTPREKARLAPTLRRAIAILYHSILYFGYGRYIWFTVRNKRQRQELRADRLRVHIQALGGMLVKLGQQLSMRLDLLPKAYCDELEKLLDQTSEFPYDQAIDAIEAQVGKPWQRVFSEINSKPVGSASIACVYEARLKTGERVAIKVRRPGIDRVFATDFRALSWTISLIEFLARMRPNVLRNFENELQEMFREELDFRIEARYQELFRRYMKKRKKLHVTAPRVFHEFSGFEVMVSEFVTGIQVKTIRDAVIRKDKRYLAYLKELDIRPKTIAKRLIRASYYTFYECPFFHGDPHSANIFVQPGNRIVLLDFGACGVFSAKDRAWMWQMQEYYTRADVAGMVQCVLGVMEPLPLMDVDRFRGELSQEWWHGYYGIQSKHAEWWERTSFRLWLALLDLFRKYQLPMPFNLLRMIRATLLYDTVAAQLFPRINVFNEFHKYYEGVVNRSKERLMESVVQQVLTGPSPENCFIIEQAIMTGKDLLFRGQQFLRQADFNFMVVRNKIFDLISMAGYFLRAVMMATMIGGAVVGFTLYRVGRGSNLSTVLRAGFFNWPWSLRLIVVLWGMTYLILAYLYGRRVSYRMGDPDNYNNRRGS